MNKKHLFFLWLTCLCTTLCAQKNEHTDPNSAAYQAMMNVKDSAMVMPESMEEEADEETDLIWYNWTERQYIHADTNCIHQDQVPDVADETYIMRLRALPTRMDMPFNQPVRNCLDLYVHRRRSLVERMVGIGYNYYFPIFEDALQRYGLPSELKYLSCIESGLRQNAYSRAHAAGLWQFIPSTGTLYGLEINSYIDERYDLYKSTDAACRMLKRLYETYNDWPLAIAAYNCGGGNVNKAIARSGGKQTFWEIYNFLPSETRAYVPFFIAATYIMTYHCEHNLCATFAEMLPECDTLMINSMVHFEQISKVLDIPREQIESLNPQYIYDIIPGSPEKERTLTLPAEKAIRFIELQDSIYAFKADSLLPHNGDLREIPQKGSRNSYVSSGGNSRMGSGAGGGSGKTYTVRKGDSLGSIARKNHTTVAQIKKKNNLKSDKIRVGQKLKL